MVVFCFVLASTAFGGELKPSFKEFFVDPVSERAVDSTGLELLVGKASDVLHSVSEGERRSIEGHHFGLPYIAMPNPGRPRLHLDIEASGGWEIEVQPGWRTIYFELIPPKKDGTLSLSFKELRFRVVRDGERLRAHFGNASESLKSGDLTVHILAEQVCFNQKCLPVPRDTGGGTLAVEGNGGLANLQIAYPDRVVFETFGEAEHSTTNPYRKDDITAWERLTYWMAWSSVLVGTAYSICDQTENPLPESARVVDAALPFVSNVHESLSRWKMWRVFDPRLGEQEMFTSREYITWDRNNWSNGFAPLAFTVSASFLDQVKENFDVLPARATLNRQGLRWIVGSGRYLPPAHWLKRATNHGVMIYAHSLASSLILNGCSLDPTGQSLLSDLVQVLEGTFKDGSSHEPPHYTDLVVGESALVAGLLNKCSIPNSIDDLYSRIAPFASALADSDGSPFVPYGDCCDETIWSPDVVEILKNFGLNDRAVLNRQETRLKNALKGAGRGGFHLRSYYLYSRYRKQVEGEESTSVCEGFFQNGIAVFRDWRGDRKLSLAAIFPKINLTHTKNFDVGSFFLSVDGREQIAEYRKEPRYAASSHNGLGIGSPHCGNGEFPDCGPRKSNAAALKEVFPVDGGCVFRGGSYSGTYFRNPEGEPVLRSFDRIFITLGLEEGRWVVLILDRLSKDPFTPISRYVNLVGTAEPSEDLSFAHTGEGKFMELADGWQRLVITENEDAALTALVSGGVCEPEIVDFSEANESGMRIELELNCQEAVPELQKKLRIDGQLFSIGLR
jgi:hypothetical protein